MWDSRQEGAGTRSTTVVDAIKFVYIYVWAMVMNGPVNNVTNMTFAVELMVPNKTWLPGQNAVLARLGKVIGQDNPLFDLFHLTEAGKLLVPEGPHLKVVSPGYFHSPS